MKTSKIFIMALACMAALSCAKEIDNPSAPAPSTNVFTAEKAEFEVPAKSTLQGKKAIWEADDEIAVYADGAAAVKFTTESEGASVQFKSETEVTGSSFLFAYPYDAAKGVQDGKLLLTIPSEQTARTGSFDPHAALSAASATDLTKAVKFKNVLALLKFNIPAELDGKISSITVESKGGEAIAGDILLNVEDKTNEPSANGVNTVRMSGAAMAQGLYYVAVRPCELASGIKVTALFADETVYTKESRACEFLVNTMYDMGNVAAEDWVEKIEPSIVPKSTSVTMKKEGLPEQLTMAVESNVEWDVVIPEEYQAWLSAERNGDDLVISVTQNNIFMSRRGKITLVPATPVNGYEGVEVAIEQPTNLFSFGPSAEAVVNEATGSVTLKLVKGKEHLTTNKIVEITKGRIVVEYENYIVGGSATYLGFQLTSTDGGTIKFRREGDNNYVFNGGGSLWVSALKKTPETFGVLEQDIKKFEIVIEDHPSKTGVQVSLYINDTLFGTWAKETTVFENGNTMRFCLDCLSNSNMTTTCHCTIKSINFYPAE